MSTTATRQIDWDSILDGYGLETQQALQNLLRNHDVPEDDPAAVVIAAQFIAQIETTRAFSGLSDTLEKGKDDIAGEIKASVEQLRGIISFAQEHLIETGNEDVQKRQEDLLSAVRQGVAKAIASGSDKLHHRSLAHTLSLILSTGALALACLVGGSILTLSVTRQKPTSALDEVENAQAWKAIAIQNQEALKACQENAVELKDRCIITLP